MARREEGATPPQPPRPAGDPEPATLAALPTETLWSAVLLTDEQLSLQTTDPLTVEDARLVRVDLGQARLSSLDIADSELKGCNLANVRIRGGSLRRCVLRDCRLTGLSWTEARFSDVHFDGCRIDLATFAATRMDRVTFSDCLMTQCDLREVAADALRLHRCQLAEADITGARFRRGEARGCDMTALSGITSLRGMAMEWSDLVGMAATFADALGIRVLDLDDEHDGRP